MIVALTGATGFVGKATVDALLGQGHEMRALARRPQPPGAVEWVMGDLADHAALARLVDGVEAVLHIAGVVNAPDRQGFEDGNVRGTLELVEAAVAAGVPRFIFVSSLAAREPGLSDYGESKARAEKIVAASGLDWTTVRPPAIYGPHDREMFELFRAARWGVVPMPPEGGRASIIHVADLARLLVALLPEDEIVSQRIFEVDDGRPGGWAHGELARAIGRALGRKVWVPHLSRQTLDRVARWDRWWRKSGAKLTADRVSYMTHPDWVADPPRAVPAHLWRAQVDTMAGLQATAQWYRAEGWL